MLHVTSLNDIQLNGAWLTIGVFDGVHRGHQAILRQLVEGAHAANCPAVVLTFASHPAEVLGHRSLKCLTTPEERAELLGALGVDVVITHPFDEQVAALSAAEFMRPLKEKLGLGRLLIGYDFALGKGREGNASRLGEIGREMGYTVQIVEAVSDESGLISSTVIRKLISVGDVADAAKMLGHSYSITGRVIHGTARGRLIGYPTANVEVPPGKLIPAFGIYACWAEVDDERYPAAQLASGQLHGARAARSRPAAISIGIRPTFDNGQHDVRVEAFLLDHDSNLYEKTVKLEFVQRLRDEMKFPSVEALIAQIESDVATVRSILK
jgi:riboflavin kinase/FMN adenylyltransferase